MNSHILLVAWKIGLITAIRPIDPDSCRSHRKNFGETSLKNQQCSLLTGSMTENAVTDDLVGVLFRVVKSRAADREIDHVMTVPRSCSW